MRRKKERVFLLLLVSFLILGASALRGAPIKLRVTAEQANIREKPGITSSVLLQVQQGSLIEAEKKEGEWYAVMVVLEGGEARLGYVHESLVEVIEPPEPKKAVEEAPLKKEPVKRVQEAQEEQKIISPPAAPPSPEAEAEKFSLALWFGARYASIGDLNDGAAGLAQYYASSLGVEGEGEVSPLHWGHAFGLEFRLPLGLGFFFSAGGEFGSGEKSSSVRLDKGSAKNLYVATPEVRIVPLNASLLFSPLPHLYVKAGLEYSYARCSYFYRFEKDTFWQQWKGKASSGTLGYLLGLGADWSILDRLSLVVEAVYRRSRLKGLEGKNTYEESTSYRSEVEGKLYYFLSRTGGEEGVPVVFIRERPPTEAGVSDMREAELSLSGLSFRAGLKMRF